MSDTEKTESEDDLRKRREHEIARDMWLDEIAICGAYMASAEEAARERRLSLAAMCFLVLLPLLLVVAAVIDLW